MKSIKLALAAMMTASFSYAASDVNSVMASMEQGLNNIQKGFLYNSIELIKSGTAQVQKENLIYLKDKKEIQAMLPKGKQQMENVAMITAQRIDQAAVEINSYINLKEMRHAQDAYTSMVKACSDCHTIVRGW